jgi:hypothetical protein
MEAERVIVPEINEQHCVQIKNTYYSCIYLTCILYYFSKLNLKFFLKNEMHSLFGDARYLRKYGICKCPVWWVLYCAVGTAPICTVTVPYVCTTLNIHSCDVNTMWRSGCEAVHRNCVHYRYQHQYDNCTYICKTCHSNGKEVMVTPRFTSSSDTSWLGIARYAWSGYVSYITSVTVMRKVKWCFDHI